MLLLVILPFLGKTGWNFISKLVFYYLMHLHLFLYLTVGIEDAFVEQNDVVVSRERSA